MNDITSIIIKPSLEEIFQKGWENHRIILFSAPCGFGKTTMARKLLSEYKVCELHASDSEFMPEDIKKNCKVVLVDDLQYLLEAKRQKALCNLIISRVDLHFILLGRGQVPGWLMPFQFAGILLTIEAPMLSFDQATAKRMLESRGIKLSSNEINEIHRHIKGYPAGMDIICRKLKDSGAYSEDILNKGKCDLFFYFEEAVYLRFEAPLRTLLISLAPFDSFNLELAKMISGDSRAGEFLGIVQRDTTMLHFDGKDKYHFWPFFQKFLMWELHKKLTDGEQRHLYSRAALYYELQGEFKKALEFYSLANEQGKVSTLLVKNAGLNPSVGYYLEMQNHYFSLSKEEILKSSSLISGMSMLTALCLDYESSEDWYNELQNYAARLKKTDFEYKNIQGKLAYLDIALPQRGSKGLINIIGNVFHIMADKQLKIPSFSVTSTLPSVMNGGKDFCEWSKKDDLLYTTMGKAVETVLGRDGVGLADCGICESKFEKGEDVTKRLLTLMSRLGEIQVKGTPDIEFAVIGLLSKVQISQGKTSAALESMENLRAKFIDTGQTRFLENIDAMICRIQMRLGDTETIRIWLQEKAPKNDVRLWVLFRYQYITRAMVNIGEGEYRDALILLARLLPYCEHCQRVMDSIYIKLLTSLCHERLGDKTWKQEFNLALDICYEYKFIWPVAQYGVAILPLLSNCKWNKDATYLEELIAATRVQAVYYPKFLKQQVQPVEQLSAAEILVLKLLCENMSNQEIGEILGIKLSTVKTHVSHILHKLGVSRRNEVKDVAEELHLI